MSASCTTDLDSPACPPLVRRLHKSVIVGLAIFFAVIIALGEPFRGYQAEVRLSGPTSDAIDAEGVRDWITRTDSRAAVAIARQTSGNARVEIRIGRVAARLTSATQALDDLARKLLAEELPQQHAAHRQSVLTSVQADLQAAREAEESLRSRAAEVREKQLALQNQSPAPQPGIAASPADPPSGYAPAPTDLAAAPAPSPADDDRRKQLNSLHLELARLLANFTEEHPKVLAIQRQIDSLQQPQAAVDARNPLGEGPDLSAAPGERAAGHQDLRSPHFVSAPAAGGSPPQGELASLTADLNAIQRELSLATRHREQVEDRLQTAVATLASNSPAAWSAEPARIVTRLGGTPRMLPVMLALIGAAIAGAVMFRATSVLALPRVLQNASDLAAALPIPLVGRNPSVSGPLAARPRALVTPARVRLVTKAAEAVLLTILAVCVCAIFLDPTLAGEFAHDPLGVVSEIFGRLLGR